DVSVRAVIDGKKHVENEGPDNRIDNGSRIDDEEGAEHDEGIEGQLDETGTNAETVLNVDGQNADATEAGAVAIKCQQPITQKQTAKQRRPERVDAVDDHPARLHFRQHRNKADGDE